MMRMQRFQAERGLSEIVGFVLILAAVVTVAALYLAYGIPAQGREGEIAHMNGVRDRFVDYKANIDSLWSNRQCGTAIGTSFTMGTGGGATTGSLSIFPLLSPARSSATLALNQRAEYLTIVSDSYLLLSSGGLDENGSINTAPSVTTVIFNTTPSRFLVSLKPTSITTRMSTYIYNSENRWSARVNVTPVYTTSWVFNLTLGSGGRVEYFWNTLNDTWNRTDVTVSTWDNTIPVVADMVVFRNITANPATNYSVDLMNPAYGIAGYLASPQTLYAYEDYSALQAMYYTNYSYAPATTTWPWLMGSLEYRAENQYWIPQTYYYQLGGVFLEQNDGNTVKVPPSLSFGITSGRPVIQVNPIILQGSGVVTGYGPAQVTSSIGSIAKIPLPQGNNTRWVNISVVTTNPNAALMWRNFFQTSAEQALFPAGSYTCSYQGYTSWINISPAQNIYGAELAMNQVNVNAILQSAVPPAGA